MENNIETKVENGKTVLFITGDLDIQLIYILKEGVEKEFLNNNYNLIVDFSKVNTINSTALGVLVSRLRVAKKNNGNIIIRNPNSYIKKIFDMVGASKIFTITE